MNEEERFELVEFFNRVNSILGAEYFTIKTFNVEVVFADTVVLRNVEIKKIEVVATRDCYEVVADIDGDREVLYSGGLKEIWVEDVIGMIETIVLHSSAFRKMVKRMFREHLNVECDDIVHGRIFFGAPAELRLMVYHDNIFMDFNITRNGMLVLLSYGIYCRKWEQGIVKDYIHGLIAAKAVDEVMR